MPYVQIWVDECEHCPPCEECRRREKGDNSVVLEIMREWLIQKDRGDYERFERFLAEQNMGAWQLIIYGPHIPAGKRKLPPMGNQGSKEIERRSV